MPYEDDYKMWLEKMLIEMNPDWVCDGMADKEFTHDWCEEYCGKDNAYITPKCLHMYYHHIARTDRKTEPTISKMEQVGEPQTERHLPDYSVEAQIGREQTDCAWGRSDA